MKRRLAALGLLLALLLLAGCAGEPAFWDFVRTQTGLSAAPAAPGDADWAIFVYLCGADLESEGGAGSLDLAEMQEVHYNGNLRFYVMTGGANDWKNDLVPEDDLAIFQIDGDGMRQVASFPAASMGDEATLTQFLTYCADASAGVTNRALILWNHGGGSLAGVCFDERFGNDSLLLPELERALAAGGMTYDFIGFDACLMASAETARVCAPYASYLVASEETEAGMGFAYRELGNAITVEGLSMPELGIQICDDYYSSCVWLGQEDLATMSVLDLRQLDALAGALDAVGAEMAAADDDDFGEIARSCAGAQNFGGNSPEEGYTNMVDLGSMLARLAPVLPAAADAQAALENLVVYSVAGSACAGASGLSIYYPLAPDGTRELTDAAALALGTGYADFLGRMATGVGGGSYVTIDSVYLDEDGYYTMAIAPDTLPYVEQVAFDLYRAQDDGSYSYLGRDDAVAIDWETGLVQDMFDGTWLCLPDGQLLQYYLTEAGQTQSTYAVPILRDGERTTLRLRYDWEAGIFEILGTWDGTGDDGQAARSVLPLAPGDTLTPVYQAGSLEGGGSWEYEGTPYTVGEDFAVSYAPLPAGDYHYRFCVTDIFGTQVTTNYTVFYVDENGEVWY